MLLGLAQTFREMAAGIDAFGQLVHDEAGPATAEPEGAAARATRSTGCTRPGPGSTSCSSPASHPDLLELHVAVLSTVKRLLRELDLAERIRRQIQLRPPRPRPRAAAPRRLRSGPPAPAAPEPSPSPSRTPRRSRSPGSPRTAADRRQASQPSGRCLRGSRSTTSR